VNVIGVSVGTRRSLEVAGRNTDLVRESNIKCDYSRKHVLLTDSEGQLSSGLLRLRRPNCLE